MRRGRHLPRAEDQGGGGQKGHLGGVGADAEVAVDLVVLRARAVGAVVKQVDHVPILKRGEGGQNRAGSRPGSRWAPGGCIRRRVGLAGDAVLGQVAQRAARRSPGRRPSACWGCSSPWGPTACAGTTGAASRRGCRRSPVRLAVQPGQAAAAEICEQMTLAWTRRVVLQIAAHLVGVAALGVGQERDPVVVLGLRAPQTGCLRSWSPATGPAAKPAPSAPGLTCRSADPDGPGLAAQREGNAAVLGHSVMGRENVAERSSSRSSGRQWRPGRCCASRLGPDSAATGMVRGVSALARKETV